MAKVFETSQSLRDVASLKRGCRCRKELPKGSDVVPFWGLFWFVGQGYNIRAKMELHRRVWLDEKEGDPPLVDLVMSRE